MLRRQYVSTLGASLLTQMPISLSALPHTDATDTTQERNLPQLSRSPLEGPRLSDSPTQYPHNPRQEAQLVFGRQQKTKKQQHASRQRQYLPDAVTAISNFYVLHSRQSQGPGRREHGPDDVGSRTDMHVTRHASGVQI